MFVRALFVLLLVLNVGVAAWWATRAPAPAPSTVAIPSGIARLQLVDETTPDVDLRRTVPSAAASPPSSAAAPVVAQCLSLGPYSSATQATAAQARLQPLAQRIVVREQPRGAGRGWRVMLPALPDAAQAEATAARIAAAGFSDYFIVRDGSEANSIALGRYGNETAARRRAEALAAAGFAARAEAIGGAAVWLDIRAAPDFDAAAARQLAAAPERRALDCGALQ